MVSQWIVRQKVVMESLQLFEWTLIFTTLMKRLLVVHHHHCLMHYASFLCSLL